MLGEAGLATRRYTVQAAWHHLRQQQAQLLSVAREDLAALDTWRHLVQEGQVEFEDRYRKEYLTAERFRRFDETLVRLLELLELPRRRKGREQRAEPPAVPYTVVRGWMRGGRPRRPAASWPRSRCWRPPCAAGSIRSARKPPPASRSTPSGSMYTRASATGWTTVPASASSELARTFHDSLNAEVERTARALLEDLEQNPVALNTLRGTRFVFDVGAIAGGIALGGLHLVSIVLVPLAASVTQYLVDLLGEKYVVLPRGTRSRQQAMFSQQLSIPMAEWLTQWPSSGGSVYERLHVIMRRLPANLEMLDPVVRRRLQ